MQLRYGAYAHALFEVVADFQREPLKDRDGFPYGVRETWTIQGELHADTQAGVTAAMIALERAYGTHFRDAILYDDAGAVARKLLNAGSDTGVQVQAFAYGASRVGAWTTFMPYTITLSADYPARQDVILEFSEQVQTQGGGPRHVLIEVEDGPPVKQMTRKQTTWRATQSGSAVGRNAYPPVPLPLWPKDLLDANPTVTRGSPKRVGFGYREYPITWSWTFAAIRPLLGQPNRPPLD